MAEPMTSKERQAAYEEYDLQHARCPGCGSRAVEATLVGPILTNPTRHRDTNRAICQACGWVGVVHDLLPLGSPLPSREELTAEVVAEVRDILAGLRKTAETPLIDGKWGSTQGSPLADFRRVREATERELAGLPAGSAMVMPAGASLTLPPVQGVQGVLERLAWLLGLSDGERSFVREAADDVTRQDNLMVFADWLMDQGRVGDAARVQKVVPQSGDVLVVRSDRANVSHGVADAIRTRLKEHGIEALVIPQPRDTSLEHFDLAAMNVRGWMRVGQHNQHLDNVYGELRGQPEETESGSLVSEAVLKMIQRLKREAWRRDNLEQARIGAAIIKEREACANLCRHLARTEISDGCAAKAEQCADAIANRPPL